MARAYNNEFVGKIGIQIGCSRATGVLLARRYLEEGMKLTIVDINPDVLNLAKELQEEFPGEEVTGVNIDASDDESVAKFFEDIDKKYGRIDMLHCHAGLIAPLMNLEDLPMEWFDKLYKVNFRAMVIAMKAAIPIMKRQKDGGSIVTTSSWYGRKGYINAAAYCASKAAIINLTQVAAIELGAYKIRVNTVAPGDVDSVMMRDSMKEKAENEGIPYDNLMQQRFDQHPLRKIATFTDVANSVLFLSSSQSSHSTGQTIYVAGGADLVF